MRRDAQPRGPFEAFDVRPRADDGGDFRTEIPPANGGGDVLERAPAAGDQHGEAVGFNFDRGHERYNITHGDAHAETRLRRAALPNLPIRPARPARHALPR